MTTDPNELAQQATGLTQSMAALEVVDAASFAAAGEQILLVATYVRRVHEVMDPICEAAFEAHKVAVRQRAALLDPALQAKLTLGQRMAEWEASERARQRQAALEAQREQDRVEAARRASAAEAHRRLLAEAETARLGQAEILEAAGDHEGADRLIAEPVEVPLVAPAPVFRPTPPAVAVPKVEGVSFRTEWRFRIVDEAKVPRQYLVVDEKRLGQVVRAMKAWAAIPGVEVYEERVSAVRTA